MVENTFDISFHFFNLLFGKLSQYLLSSKDSEVCTNNIISGIKNKEISKIKNLKK